MIVMFDELRVLFSYLGLKYVFFSIICINSRIGE